jgi:hypothetical protein
VIAETLWGLSFGPVHLWRAGWLAIMNSSTAVPAWERGMQMIEEVVDTVVPGGAWLVAGLALGASVAAGGLRPAAKTVLKASMAVADRVQEVGTEAMESAQDLMAEVRHEREQARAQTQAPRPAPARRRAGATQSE